VAVSGAMRQRANVARGLLAALTIMLATRQNICSEAMTAGGNLHAAIDRSFHAPI